MSTPTSAGLIALMAIAAPAHAHDHWLDVTATSTATTLRHYVGEALVPELSRGWEPDKADRIVLFGPRGVVDLRAEHPAPKSGSPALVRGPLGAGTSVLVLDRKPVSITLERAELAAYLAEEGIDASLARRKIAVDPAQPGRERYTRHLKAIVGGSDVAAVTKSYGQRLELTPLAAIGRAGTKLRVRVTLDGAPLVGAAVFAETRGATGLVRVRLETSARGEIVVPLSVAGRWLVRLVHMDRCATDCAATDWVSAWGALTFDVAR